MPLFVDPKSLRDIAAKYARQPYVPCRACIVQKKFKNAHTVYTHTRFEYYFNAANIQIYSEMLDDNFDEVADEVAEAEECDAGEGASAPSIYTSEIPEAGNVAASFAAIAATDPTSGDVFEIIDSDETDDTTNDGKVTKSPNWTCRSHDAKSVNPNSDCESNEGCRKYSGSTFG